MKIKILLLILILFTSCNKEIEKPENLIPEDKMVEIIKDFYVYKNLQSINKFDYEDFYKVNYKILEKHKVSYDQFKESYQYYLIEDEKYKSILEQIEKEMKEEFEVSDSIQLEELKIPHNVELH